MKSFLSILFFLLFISSNSLFAQKKEPLTNINEGLQLKDIHSVILKNAAGLAITPMSYSSTLILRVTPYLLLNDGTIYSRPYASPHDLDVLTSRKLNPDNWGKCSKVTDGLHIQFKKPQKWKAYYKTLPAKANQKINGIYKCSGAFKLSSNSKFNTIIFKEDGTFILRYFYKNDKKFKPHSYDSRSKGNYKLKNYTIELILQNNQKTRFIFASFAKGSGMLIGSKSFAKFEIPAQYK